MLRLTCAADRSLNAAGPSRQQPRCLGAALAVALHLLDQSNSPPHAAVDDADSLPTPASYTPSRVLLITSGPVTKVCWASMHCRLAICVTTQTCIGACERRKSVLVKIWCSLQLALKAETRQLVYKSCGSQSCAAHVMLALCNFHCQVWQDLGLTHRRGILTFLLCRTSSTSLVHDKHVIQLAVHLECRWVHVPQLVDMTFALVPSVPAAAKRIAACKKRHLPLALHSLP